MKFYYIVYYIKTMYKFSYIHSLLSIHVGVMLLKFERHFWFLVSLKPVSFHAVHPCFVFHITMHWFEIHFTFYSMTYCVSIYVIVEYCMYLISSMNICVPFRIHIKLVNIIQTVFDITYIIVTRLLNYLRVVLFYMVFYFYPYKSATGDCSVYRLCKD